MTCSVVVPALRTAIRQPCKLMALKASRFKSSIHWPPADVADGFIMISFKIIWPVVRMGAVGAPLGTVLGCTLAVGLDVGVGWSDGSLDCVGLVDG